MPSVMHQQIRQFVGFFVAFALALFLPAGTLAWSAAWVFLALFFGFYLALTVWLIRHNPALLRERMRLRTADQQGWDKVLFPVLLSFPFAWLIFVSFDAVRALVACPGLASGRWCDRPGRLIRALVPDVSGKYVSVSGRPHSRGARAHRRLHRSVSLCATSNVCCHCGLCGGDAAPARILVRRAGGAAVCGLAGAAGDIGGTHVASETAGLRSLSGAGSIPTHSVYLVSVTRLFQDEPTRCRPTRASSRRR
jgi:hypothetical protein